MNGLKIGEVARRTGLTVRALRHDDELGLLTPRAWMGLVREFTGGNQEIVDTVQHVWETEGEQFVQQHGMNPRTMEFAEYVNRALAESN